MRLVEYFIVSEQGGAPVAVEVQIGTEVPFHLTLRVVEQVRIDKGRALRLFELHVDLSCDALEAVLHRRGTFRYLYALHPWTWYVAQ